MVPYNTFSHLSLSFYTDVLQEWVFRGTRKPPEVTRVNPSELADLTQNVLLHQDRAGVMDVDDVDTTLLKFVMCHQETTLTGNVIMAGLAAHQVSLVIARQNVKYT